MTIIEFQAKKDFQIKQGSYYTILIDSLTGHMQIVDAFGNYDNIGRSAPSPSSQEDREIGADQIR